MKKLYLCLFLVMAFGLFIFVGFRVYAAEPATYTMEEDDVTYTLEIIDDSKCSITGTNGETTMNAIVSYKDVEEGKIDVDIFGVLVLNADGTFAEDVVADPYPDEDKGFELDDETIAAIIAAIASVTQGDVIDAYATLKTYVGIALATAVICLLVAVLFIVKYIKASAVKKAIEAKVSAETATKVNNYLDELEVKVNATLNQIDLKIGMVDEAKKAKAKEQMVALNETLTTARLTLD